MCICPKNSKWAQGMMSGDDHIPSNFIRGYPKCTRRTDACDNRNIPYKIGRTSPKSGKRCIEQLFKFAALGFNAESTENLEKHPILERESQ
jgi:hypothetical protein